MIPPWHMWGNEVGLEVRGQSSTSTQLARINYKRPESWSFFLGAELRSFLESPAQQTVSAAIDIVAGVGRSNFDTKVRSPASAFAFFEWIIPGGATMNDIVAPKRFTTRVQGPPLVDSDPDTRPTIDRIVAQDIQVEGRAGTASGVYEIRLFAFFAPFVHVRPDWFTVDTIDVQRFTGGETKGT